MIYIKLENKLENYNKGKGYIKRKLDKIRNYFFKLEIENFENIILIKIPNTEKYVLNKIENYIKIKCVNQVCLCQQLMGNQEFVEFIKSKNVKIFDGRWLFEFLTKNCIEYISSSKNEKMQYQEISFLMNKINSRRVFLLLDVATSVKVLNIITSNIEQFKNIEKRLYENDGIILNVSNNYTKSLIKSDIIINFDFSEEEINKYEIPKKSCIVNLNQDVDIKTKSFDGVKANFYEIQMPTKYMKNILLNDFSNEVVYESYIYKNTAPENIKKELKQDNIRINFLIGKKDKIRKNEYLKLSKKIAN